MPWRVPQFRPRKRTTDQRPSSHARGYGSPAWQRVRIQVIARDGGCCRACGLVIHRPRDAHIDHVEKKPVNEAAESTPISGLQLLCAKCHGEKTRREQED